MSDDYVESLLEQGIDVQQRIIWINEEISNETFRRISKALSLMAGTEPVTIILNSEGGDYYDSLAIADLIQSSEKPIHIKGFGRIMSGALLVMAAGEHRTAGKATWFLYHNSLYQQEGGHKDVKASVEQAEREELQSADFMAHCTDKPAKYWKEIADTKDFYFTAKEALELGVIDGIE